MSGIAWVCLTRGYRLWIVLGDALVGGWMSNASDLLPFDLAGVTAGGRDRGPGPGECDPR